MKLCTLIHRYGHSFYVYIASKFLNSLVEGNLESNEVCSSKTKTVSFFWHDRAVLYCDHFYLMISSPSQIFL